MSILNDYNRNSSKILSTIRLPYNDQINCIQIALHDLMVMFSLNFSLSSFQSLYGELLYFNELDSAFTFSTIYCILASYKMKWIIIVNAASKLIAYILTAFTYI